MLVGADNRAHQKAVKVGIRQDEDVQIVDGLKEGDKVVAAGAYGLPDNTKITVEEAKSSESKDSADDKKADDKKPDAKAGDKDEKDDKNDKP
jgi:hypothetical protein